MNVTYLIVLFYFFLLLQQCNRECYIPVLFEVRENILQQCNEECYIPVLFQVREDILQQCNGECYIPVLFEVREDILQQCNKEWHDFFFLFTAIHHVEQSGCEFSQEHQRMDTESLACGRGRGSLGATPTPWIYRFITNSSEFCKAYSVSAVIFVLIYNFIVCLRNRKPLAWTYRA